MSPQREGMIAVTPEDSLYEACKLLRDNRLHRLPVLDPIQNSVLSVITHSGILEYLVATFREQRRLFDQPIFDLGIGVYSNLITVPEDMPLMRVLHTLVERRVSALPIVDSSGASIDIMWIGCDSYCDFGLLTVLPIGFFFFFFCPGMVVNIYCVSNVTVSHALLSLEYGSFVKDMSI